MEAKSAQDFSYPVRVEEVLGLPDFASEEDFRKALNDESDEIAREAGAKGKLLNECDKEAAFRLHQWWLQASEEYPIIDQMGILRYHMSRRSSRFWITLLRAKQEGRVFPL